MSLQIHTAIERARARLSDGDAPGALQVMTEVAATVPDDPAVLTALGVALRFNGRMDEAAAAFVRALYIDPDRADAQVFLGMIRLGQDRQAEGWQLYEARWRFQGWTEKLRYPAEELWNGRLSPGLHLLLWGEQGLGDTIQFSRYAPWLFHLLRERGGSLTLEVHERLVRLLRMAWPFLDVTVAGRTVGRFDAHLPLMSLPHRAGGHVGSGGLPCQPGSMPYLVAPPHVLASRPGVVSRPSGKSENPLRVGIAWQGRPTHPDDRWRSVPPEVLEPLFFVPDICWVSLQKGPVPAPAWMRDDLAGCRDFADTAQLVGTLDLVISIDSAVAHLAGALGRPVWLLLPRIADWRWPRTGDVTPWYSDMRLFRQGKNEDWSRVAARVAAALPAVRERVDAGAVRFEDPEPEDINGRNVM